MKTRKVLAIILVIVWMSIVFSFSNQQGESSGNTSKKVTEIIVNIIDIQNKYTELEKEKLVEIIEPIIRKLAHYTIYTIGGIIIANCIYQFSNKEKTIIVISAIIGILYAISDETHQLIVAGRSGNIKDVTIDSLGVITGIIFFLLIKGIIVKVHNNKNTIRGENKLVVEQSNLSTIDNEIIKNNIKEPIISLKDRRSIIIKRGIDLVAGIVGCLLLVPITLFVVIANIINKDNGPIFFTQKRIGKNGKIFKMYKYRTMVVGAEEILQKHIDEQTEIGKEYIEHKKIKNDPRITKVGKFLRATSLDEFPQFINVIKGQMSLVGPRPYLPREQEDMKEYYDYIVKMKPGVTGPWQVAGRNELEFEDRLELDKEYCDRRGNRRDIKILFKTIAKVVKKEGAI